MDDEEPQARVGVGYPQAQLATAFVTALTHEDADTRRRAENRLRHWDRVLRGMAAATLTIGSRAPVAGLPSWVTPQVVRGGFATGDAAAGGPMAAHEIAAARRAGVPGDRRRLFLHHLTEVGITELGALLDSGRYEIAVPEEAALLTVAWLLRAGDGGAALTLLEEIEPFTDRLTFLPRPADGAPPGGAVVHRETVGAVRGRLDARRESGSVAAMNEALTVWNPFADELLAHWLQTVEAGRVGSVHPGGWQERGRALLGTYRRLAERHTRCTKHRRPKENIAILRAALEAAVVGAGPDPRQHGLLQHAVDAMVRRRGAPGTKGHAALRGRQAVHAARPTRHALAQLLVARLSTVPQNGGLPSPDALLGPVTGEEERDTAVPAGTAIPDPLRQVVESTLSAPVTTLMERGVIPSAEVLAELVPQLVASTTTLAYPDDTLRSLMAAVYRAFRNRRSLLLLNLESQVRLDELPWVRAVAPYRRPSDDVRGHARAALVQLAELALQGFPATVLPNPMISELQALSRSAGMDVPLVEELAADIFIGTFSAKFLRAAQLAADVLEGTLYARYYGIDYAAIRAMRCAPSNRMFSKPPAHALAALCRARAGDPPYLSVAANGMIIEQAQILTSHNLAALVHPIGVRPAPGWPDLARRTFAVVCRTVARVQGNPFPSRTVKDAAYAWRQLLFHLSCCTTADQIAVTAWIQDEVERHPEHVRTRLAGVLDGLRHVLVGGDLDDGSAPATTRRFLGWSDSGHWMCAAPTASKR